jgi:hypothetical protein
MEPTIYKPSIYNGAGIYKAGAEGGGGGGGVIPTPEGYESIDYLEINRIYGNGVSIPFNGFRTNFKDNQKLKINILFELVESDDVSMLYTQSYGAQNDYINASNTYYNTICWNDAILGPYPGMVLDEYVGKDVNLNIKLNTVEWNEIQYTVSNGIKNLDSFCVGAKPFGNRSMHIKLKQIKIYFDNNLICFCYPVKRLLDEVNGMLDTITNEFFTL